MKYNFVERINSQICTVYDVKRLSRTKRETIFFSQRVSKIETVSALNVIIFSRRKTKREGEIFECLSIEYATIDLRSWRNGWHFDALPTEVHNGCSKIYSVLRDSKLRSHKARTRGPERSQANLKKHFRFVLAWHQLVCQFALLSTGLDFLDSVNTRRTVNLKHWHKIVRIIPAWGRAKIPWFIVKSDPLLRGYRAFRLILYPPISVEYIYLFIYLFTFSIFSGVDTGQTFGFPPCYTF